jgi:hypothetical protein
MFCGQCGKENPNSGVFCWNCGTKLHKEENQKDEVRPRRPDDAPKSNAMRQQKNLMVPRGAALPQVCVKCGAPGVPYSYKFAWTSPGYLALFFLGIFPYFLVRLFVRKTVRLLVPLCEQHHRVAKNSGIAGIVVLLVSIPAGFALARIILVRPNSADHQWRKEPPM